MGKLSANDHAVIEAVQILGQVTSKQLTRLCFPHLSPVSDGRGARRVLKRLHDTGYIDRLGERTIGHAVSGSDGYTYIPAKGKATRLEPHTIDISEFYVLLTEAERAGRLKVLEFSPTERIRGSRVKSDAYLWLEIDGQRADWYIEIDRASESKPEVALKTRAYTRAASDHAEFPRVLYVVSFAPRNRLAERVRLLKSVGAASEFPEMFEVTTLVEVVDRLCVL